MREQVARRQVLGWGLGGLAAALVVAACGSDGGGGGESSSPTTGEAGSGVELKMFASPSCGCCGSHAAYLEENGYVVDLQRTDELDAIRAELGVPEEVVGCHLAQVGAYLVEGHVPVEAIDQLLADEPDVDGIALPGMPTGSPGMGDDPDATFEILSFTGTDVRPYVTV